MYKINKGVISQKIGKKITIFDNEESIFYTFNETASLIFAKLKKAAKEKTIVDLLAKKYHVKRQIAEKDYKEFISELIKKKIIFVLNSKKPVGLPSDQKKPKV